MESFLLNSPILRSYQRHTDSLLPSTALHKPPVDAQFPPSSVSRRQHLALLSALPTLALSLPASAGALPLPPQLPSLPGIPNYASPGPLTALRLPNLEHTCTVCDAPAERSRLRIHAWVPKGAGRLGLTAPFPLAIITPGFLIGADQYNSYAERLATWGYVVVTYDRTQAALDPISDVGCVAFLKDLIDWCRTSVPLGKLCDSNLVYLIGHSRGGKISALAAAEDPRVKALFLIDPVDVTVYAPLSPEFPSAVEALQGLGARQRSLPLAVVGSGRGGDCVPETSNFSKFFAASESPAWELVLADAGHLQYLDSRGGQAMDLICTAGKIPDSAVNQATAAMMVAWGELMVRKGEGQMGKNEDEARKSAAEIRGKSSAAAAAAEGKSSEIESTSSKRLQMAVDSEGRLVAGVASFDAMQALYATENAVRAALKDMGLENVDLTTRVKNFEF